jgi:hypothetical protein
MATNSDIAQAVGELLETFLGDQGRRCIDATAESFKVYSAPCALGEEALGVVSDLQPEQVFTKEELFQAVRRIGSPSDVWEVSELRSEIDSLEEEYMGGRI